MKRKDFVVLVLVLAFLFSCLGCSTENGSKPGERSTSDEPLRICLDLAYLSIENESPEYSYESAVEGAAQGLMTEVMARGGADDYVIEAIPKEEAARRSMLTKLRTEIMSGEGPDVFIMGCDTSRFDAKDMLFPIPENAMQNGLFLPLDEYMADGTKYTEWDKLQQTVLSAGKNDEGQLIIPIAYTVPVAFFRASDVAFRPDEKTTWDDMLEDSTGVLSSAASWFNMNEALLHMRGSCIEYTFGQLADYEAESLLFTPDELKRRAEEIRSVNEKSENNVINNVPAHYKTCLSVDFNNETGSNLALSIGAMGTGDPFSGIKPTDAQTMIPIYSDDGGASASITAFAAVNRNTLRPEDAFMVLDVLMDLETQKRSVLYENWFTQIYGIPMHEELLQPTCPAMYTAKSKPWYLREENYNELCRVREQITFARFRGALDIEMENAYHACTGTNAEEAIQECYRRMERLLGE